jgi:hypothetical protein
MDKTKRRAWCGMPCNPRTGEDEAGGSGLQKPCLKKLKKKKRKKKPEDV